MPAWLKHLLRHQDTHTAEQAGRFAHGTPRKNIEIIRTPEQGLLLGRGDTFFSTYQPDETIQVATLPNGNRLFPLNDYIISTVGLKPRTGEIAHPSGGGCQNRAFCNFLDMDQPHDEHARNLFDLAERMFNTIETRWSYIGDQNAENFRYVGPDLMERYATDLGLTFTPHPTGSLADILRHEPAGIIKADTTPRHLEGHLVAFRDGKQIVTDPSQIIRDQYNYSWGDDMENVRIRSLITRGDPIWARSGPNPQQ